MMDKTSHDYFARGRGEIGFIQFVLGCSPEGHINALDPDKIDFRRWLKI